MRINSLLSLLLIAPLVLGCALQRAQDAENAKAKMVGMSKEDVFTCMGPPAQKSSEGKTEIWSYPSGNGYAEGVAVGNTFGGGTATANGNNATAYGSSVAIASGSSERRFCVVNLVIAHGKVTSVNYNGPTGGLLTKGEQCAYAIENCVKHDDKSNSAQ